MPYVGLMKSTKNTAPRSERLCGGALYQGAHKTRQPQLGRPGGRSRDLCYEVSETREAVSQTRVFQVSSTTTSLAKYSASPPQGFLKYQYCCELT